MRPWSGGDADGPDGVASSVGVNGEQGPLLPGTARKASFERSGRWSDWT